MPNKRLLLLSNSKNYGEAYLAHAAGYIKDFLGSSVGTVALVPFAGVRISFDDYAANVRAPFEQMGYKVVSVHEASDPREAVASAEAIVVGGGNTFHLLRGMYEAGLVEVIRERASGGVPYIGWSAGSNVACPTIKTTNDMPIVEPPTFTALGLVPFQINPHYTDFHPPKHQGETRAERLAEFVEANPGVYVIGLREGSLLRVEGSDITLLGGKDAKIFFKGRDSFDLKPQASLQFLLEQAAR